jgi:hypothetical protein
MGDAHHGHLAQVSLHRPASWSRVCERSQLRVPASDHGCGKDVLPSSEVSVQSARVLCREVGLLWSSKPTTGPRDYISIWLATGELAQSRARQISMSPWIVVAIQSTSTSVGAVVHDDTFARVDELNCGMVRFLFTCGGIAILRWFRLVFYHIWWNFGSYLGSEVRILHRSKLWR